ncbi:hypothetical protein GS429_03655 [Natronorubrum sp. JWXQ-INN-674]|uniref:Uncharacterized protein n=1 Tax=Natronorubrum halalkaliphilum TaxID=2691917 RepID=A0A6B0VHX7_9EURY|nr:hypothetical protein [Natronorubrum halalkaliphilum]MXV61168.1 hypothetical protein [Natronorubrum halalkaliphilum]
MNRRQVVLGTAGSVATLVAGCADETAKTGEQPAETDGDAEDSEETDDGTSPDEPAVEQPEIQILSGSGNSLESVDLEGGVAVVEGAHGGDSSFRVTLRGEDEAVVFDTDGEYEGKAARSLASGPYTVEFEADGPWRLEVNQPRATEGYALPREFAADVPSVVGPVDFDGGDRHTAVVSHDGDDAFRARVYSMAVASDERIVETTDDEAESTFNYDGFGWIDVDADGSWTLALE